MNDRAVSVKTRRAEDTEVKIINCTRHKKINGLQKIEQNLLEGEHNDVNVSTSKHIVQRLIGHLRLGEMLVHHLYERVRSIKVMLNTNETNGTPKIKRT